MTKYRAKVDANQAQIVEELRACGYSVAHCHRQGGGFPDLAVGWGGVTLLVEVKAPRKQNPTAEDGYKMLTPDEVAFFDTFDGAAIVAVSAQDVLDWYTENHADQQ